MSPKVQAQFNERHGRVQMFYDSFMYGVRNAIYSFLNGMGRGAVNGLSRATRQDVLD